MKKYLNEHTTLLEIKNKTNHEIPVIISIPHSGAYILPEMKHKLTSGIILPNSDWYLPKLYSFLESLGYTVIINNVNRYVIDVNRQIDEKLVILIKQMSSILIQHKMIKSITLL